MQSIIHARTKIDEAITTICEYAYKHLQKINDKVPRYYTSLLIVQLSHGHWRTTYNLYILAWCTSMYYINCTTIIYWLIFYNLWILATWHLTSTSKYAYKHLQKKKTCVSDGGTGCSLSGRITHISAKRRPKNATPGRCTMWMETQTISEDEGVLWWWPADVWRSYIINVSSFITGDKYLWTMQYEWHVSSILP